MRLINKVIVAGFIAIALIHFGPHGGTMPFPGVSPIDHKGLCVLVNYETNNLPQEYVSVVNSLQSGDLSVWLDSKCAKLEDGTTAHRVWDENVDLTQQPKFWQDAFAKRQPPPAIMVSNGRRGFSGPLPKDAEATKTLLEKYAR